jgi:putative membrane protein
MIVDTKPNWWRMVWTVRGSTITSTWPRIAGATLWSVLITIVWTEWGLARFSLTTTPFSLIGVALSIFLGFRNNAAYDRFWEARKLWGRLVNASRTWARQVDSYVVGDGSADLRRELIERQIAYVHAFRQHLRNLPCDVDLPEIDELRQRQNPPSVISYGNGQRLGRAVREGWLDPVVLPALEGTLTEITGLQGGCERIKATPAPFVYTVLTHRIVALYCLALPFGIEATVGLLTPLVVAMISFAFYGLDAIGDEIEEPFGLDTNDLPLDQLSVMIERDLREVLGQDKPDAHGPKDGVLT